MPPKPKIPGSKKPKKPAPSPKQTPGELIREARLRRGWTQDDLGVSLGVSKQRVYAVESGREVASLDWLLRVARALDLRPSDLDPSLASLVTDVTQPAAKVTMALDGSGPDTDYGRWVPMGDRDDATLRQIGAARASTIAELVRLTAEHRVALIFRGDLPPLA